MLQVRTAVLILARPRSGNQTRLTISSTLRCLSISWRTKTLVSSRVEGSWILRVSRRTFRYRDRTRLRWRNCGTFSVALLNKSFPGRTAAYVIQTQCLAETRTRGASRVASYLMHNRHLHKAKSSSADLAYSSWGWLHAEELDWAPNLVRAAASR